MFRNRTRALCHDWKESKLAKTQGLNLRKFYLYFTLINCRVICSHTIRYNLIMTQIEYSQTFCIGLTELWVVGDFNSTVYDEELDTFEPVFNSLAVISCTLFLSCLPNNDKQHKCGLPHNSLYQASKRPYDKNTQITLV